MTNTSTLVANNVTQFNNPQTNIPQSLLGGLLPTAKKGVSINPNCLTSELLKLPHVEINREFKRRLKKMLKPFSKALMGQQIFVVFNVTKRLEFELPGEQTIIVEPGYSTADGNTRLESMRQGNIPTPESVIVLVFDIESEEQYQSEYYAIDNSAATEVSTDKIRGAIAFLNLNVKSRIATNGQFSWALRNAFPHDEKVGILEKIAYFKNEIEFLDECGIFDPVEKELKTQNFYSACLIMAKQYSVPPSSRASLRKVFESLARLDFDDLKMQNEKWNGVTALIYQMCRPEKRQWFDPIHKSSTKFDATIPVISFFLYCMQNQMQDKLLNKETGFKHSNWGCGKNSQRGEDLYSSMQNDLQENYPL